MNTLVELALSNLLMAAVLAVPALLVGAWGRRPAWTHALWLLVLLKLVTPPLWRVPISLPEIATETPAPVPVENALLAPPAPANDDPIVPSEPPVAVPPPEAAAPPEAPPPIVNEPNAEEEPDAVPAVEASSDWTDWLVVLWLTGTLCWFVLAARRLDRFQRLLRFAQPAPGDVQAEAHALATRLGVRCPAVFVLPGTVSPMLWAVGRSARLLLPAELLVRLRPSQRATLLLHELAHWRRRDHHVRWLEVAALGLYWWCPLAWWACRQLRQAEEECCDAWVVAVLPEAAREYALALVETIDFLSGTAPVLPPAASGAGHVRRLQRRLTMILRGNTPQALPRVGWLALVGLGLALMPFVPGLAQPPRPEPDPFDPAARQRQEKLKNEGAAIAKAFQQGDAKLLKQMQDQLEEARHALEEQRRILEQKAEMIRRALQGAGAGGVGGGGAGGAGGFGGGGRGGAAGFGGGAGGAGGGGKATGTIRVGGAPTGAMEQRLEQVEKKLDTLLWEVTNVRKDLANLRTAPPAAGQRPGYPPMGRFSTTPPPGNEPAPAAGPTAPPPPRGYPGGPPAPPGVPAGPKN